MKKKSAMLLTVSALAVLGLASCGTAPDVASSSIAPDTIDSYSTVITASKITIDDADGSANVKIRGSKTEFEAGSTVSFSVSAEDYALIQGVYFDGDKIGEKEGDYTVTMPNKDAEIKVTTRILGDKDLLSVSKVSDDSVPTLSSEEKDSFSAVKAMYTKLEAVITKSASVESKLVSSATYSGNKSKVGYNATGLGTSTAESYFTKTFGQDDQTTIFSTKKSYSSYSYEKAQYGISASGKYYEEYASSSSSSYDSSKWNNSSHTITMPTVIADGKDEEGNDIKAEATEILESDKEKKLHQVGVTAQFLSLYFSADSQSTDSFILEEEVKSSAAAGYVGTWTLKTSGNTVTLVLNADGSGTYNGTSITYTVSGSKISFTCGDMEVALTYNETAGTMSGYFEQDYEQYYYTSITKVADASSDDSSSSSSEEENKSYKRKVISYSTKFNADKTSYTIDLVVGYDKSTYTFERDTLSITVDGDGLITAMSYLQETASKDDVEDGNIKNDATTSTVSSFSYSANRGYKGIISPVQIENYVMTDFDVVWENERVNGVSGNSTLGLDGHTVYADGTLEATKFINNDTTSYTALIKPVVKEIKEGSDLLTYDPKTSYFKIGTKTGKAVITFDNQNGLTKDIELNIVAAPVMKMTKSVSSTKGFVETPFTVKVTSAPSSAENKDVALSFGEGVGEDEISYVKTTDDDGAVTFTITPHVEGVYTGTLTSVSNSKISDTFTYNAMALPNYDTVVTNLTSKTIGYKKTYEVSWYDNTDEIYFNFDAPTEGVGTGTWSSTRLYGYSDSKVTIYGSFRYTIVNNNGVPEITLTKSTAKADGTYDALSVYIYSTSSAYTISSFTVESNSTFILETDKMFSNYDESARKYSLELLDRKSDDEMKPSGATEK